MDAVEPVMLEASEDDAPVEEVPVLAKPLLLLIGLEDELVLAEGDVVAGVSLVAKLPVLLVGVVAEVALAAEELYVLDVPLLAVPVLA